MQNDDDDFWEEEQRYEAEQEVAAEEYESRLREQFMPELYEEFARDVLSGKHDLSGEIVEQFTSERLQSFYLSNRNVAGPALRALEEGRALARLHPSAALVFAAIAIEVGLKSTLLKPIVHGLVNIDSAATLITGLVPSEHNERFQKALCGILKEVGGVDLLVFTRPGSDKSLWEEILNTRTRRNNVIHRGEEAPLVDAERAIAIASVVLEELFPKVIASLGLKTDARLRILDK